jgi:hypothetical protein
MLHGSGPVEADAVRHLMAAFREVDDQRAIAFEDESVCIDPGLIRPDVRDMGANRGSDQSMTLPAFHDAIDRIDRCVMVWGIWSAEADQNFPE